MRKVDYQALADTIREERNRVMHAWYDDENTRLVVLDSLRKLTERFVCRASVDKVKFLRACGLER